MTSDAVQCSAGLKLKLRQSDAEIMRFRQSWLQCQTTSVFFMQIDALPVLFPVKRSLTGSRHDCTKFHFRPSVSLS